ncbi:hypothetical protein, partial [Dyadobacter sp. 50-39]|uniref:hypothetical protein n=1 Tax=Dyadobacter sp. 50-39 TaxID=1895756 RepID=UPI0025BE3701
SRFFRTFKHNLNRLMFSMCDIKTFDSRREDALTQVDTMYDVFWADRVSTLLRWPIRLAITRPISLHSHRLK